jgi:hypothetical protein
MSKGIGETGALAAEGGSVNLTQQRLTSAEIRAKAEAWYARQVAVLEKVYGQRWPLHCAWIEGYLREELRQRLMEIGWRPKR